jgi:two-component system, response regulator YesN
MYRVFIADDEPLICKGLRDTIEWDSLGLEISGEAHNGTDALAGMLQTPPHILITDIRMPEMDGISLIKAIRERELNIKILILSGFSDTQFLKDAIRLGVDGYLLKPIDTDELISNLSNLVSIIDEEIFRTSQLYQGLELMRTNTLNRLVTNEIRRGEFDEKAALLELALDAEHYLCAVCLFADDGGNAWTQADPNAMMTLRDTAQALAGNSAAAFLDAKGRLVLLFFAAAEQTVQNCSKDLLAQIAEHSKTRLGRPLVYSCGIAVSALEAVHLSYAAAADGFEQERILHQKYQLEGQWKGIVNRTVNYVAAHYHEALSLKQIAGLCSINTSYLGQLFKKSTGDSFTNYVNRYRVDKARELLSQTNLKVYEVSQRVGFTDYHYFLKIYKKITGALPTDSRSDNFYHKS